jgi:type IV secretion system protein VirB5
MTLAQQAQLPLSDMRRKTIRVTVTSILRVTGESWQVNWREDTVSQTGTVEKTETWGAMLTLKAAPPITPETPAEEAKRYPLGVYLYDLSWAPQTR